MKVPRPEYHLTRVLHGRDPEPVQVVPVSDVPLDTVVDRRGMLGIGIGAAALLATWREAAAQGTPQGAAQGARSEPRAPSPTRNAHMQNVNALLVIPAHNLLASASADNSIKLWRLDDGSFVKRLAGHNDDVVALAASPDGNTLYSASREGSLRSWTLPDGAPGAFAMTLGAPLSAMLLANQGRQVITATPDGTVRIWSLPEGRLHASLPAQSGTTPRLAVSADGQSVLMRSGFQEALTLWSLPNGDLTRRIGDLRLGQATAFSSDLSRIATATTAGTVTIRALADGATIQTFSAYPTSARENVRTMAASTDGAFLAIGAMSGRIVVWDGEGRTSRADLAGIGSTDAMAFTGEKGRLVSAHGGGVIVLWDIATPGFVKYLVDPDLAVARGDSSTPVRAHRDAIRGLALAPDGRSVVSGSSGEKTAKVWAIPSGRLTATFGGHKESIAAVVDDTAPVVLTASSDGALIGWQLPPAAAAPAPAGGGRGNARTSAPPRALTGTALFETTTEGYNPSISVARAARLFATTRPDRSVVVSSLVDGKAIATFAEPPDPGFSPSSMTGTPSQSVLSPDGTLIAIRRRTTPIEVHVVSDRRLLSVIRTAGTPTRLDWSPDGKTLAVGTSDGTVELWSMPDSRLVGRTNAFSPSTSRTPAVSAIKFLGDGSRLLLGSEMGAVALVSTADLRRLRVAEDHPDSVLSLHLTPNERMVVSTSRDWTVRLWTAAALDLIATLRGHNSAVVDAVVMPDGKWLVTADMAGVAIVWDLEKRAMHGYLFDPLATRSDQKALSYDVLDRVTGQVITYTLPCGSPIPAGATCTCNCVAGTYSVPVPTYRGGGGGGGGGGTVCTCNRICTCVPILR